MSNRKLRIPVTVKLYKNNKMIHSSVCLKKSQILVRARRILWDKAYIKVSYGEDIGYNDSDHYSIDTLSSALSAYTEKSLLDFLLAETGAA